MATMSAQLESDIKAMAANETINLIVWTDGDATPHLNWLKTEGIEVRQQYKLKPGIAITCSGSNALKLLPQAWVLEIKEDGTVQTQ